MKIFHYTTIDSLALILKNKTLLFNRLDCVDDLEEGEVESSGIKLGRYIFVSCWTESSEESIPIWKMYAGDGMGVRIGMERDMFKRFYIENPIWGGQQWRGSMWQLLPPSEFEDESYFVLPFLSFDDNSIFYNKIQYVDDVFEKTKDAAKMEPTGDGKANATVMIGEIGKYKHKRWAFQEESRFRIHIFPINPLLVDPNEVGTVAMQALFQNKQLPFTKYFMHLNEEVLSNIEITLSPTANDGHRAIIESLKLLYAPNATIKESSLGRLMKI